MSSSGSVHEVAAPSARPTAMAVISFGSSFIRFIFCKKRLPSKTTQLGYRVGLETKLPILLNLFFFTTCVNFLLPLRNAIATVGHDVLASDGHRRVGCQKSNDGSNLPRLVELTTGSIGLPLG